MTHLLYMVYVMNKASRQHIKPILIAMALLLVSGSAWAQSDSPYVIKTIISGQEHYLAHVLDGTNWVVTDATAFDTTCLWYSGIEQNITGTNHNYYFNDGTNLHFLSAPMLPNRTLSVSETLPPTYLLTNTDTIYYFYDWDKDNYPIDGGGVARGHQYYGYDEGQCDACNASWGADDQQCWRVYWVAYKSGTGWKTTSKSYYDVNDIVVEDDGKGGRYRQVTATDVVNPTQGGLTSLTGFDMNYNTPHPLSVSVTTPYSYIAYTQYSYKENGTTRNHYYYNHQDHAAAPTSATGTAQSVTKYEWSLTGPGAEYLTFTSDSLVNSITVTVTGSTPPTQPTIYFYEENKTGDKDATLKLKVTYDDKSTQESTATVTVKTTCQNPPQAAAPVVNYDDVVVTWYDIATKYKLEWRKTAELDAWSTPVEINSGSSNTISHRITGLEYNTAYTYRVTAYCTDWLESPESTGTFTTRGASELLIYGAVFGGGRMANVTGKTEVIVVNCDSIGAIYGGNDIAGEVQGSDGSSITLGVTTGSGTAVTSADVKIGAVYGGGNGYYTYDDHAPGPAIGTTLHTNRLFSESVTEVGGSTSYLASGTIPTITKTAITVNSDHIKVDSIFGGAKNAFLTATTGNGSDIDVKGGTIYAVFGGNNYGGTQGAATQHVLVEGTTVETSVSNYNSKKIGRDFGIGYVFGGGNKVAGSATEVIIEGGQCDTVFAGGNAADVAEATVTMNCSLAAASSGIQFGNVYSNAISSCTSSGEPPTYTLTIDEANYDWNGTGIYNVRALFGGNNRAAMAVVPTITLTSGSVGTVYGGGNAGDMNGEVTTAGIATDFGALVIENTTYNIYHSTHVVLNSSNMVIDYLYGGCQMSDVYRSTWVEMSAGYVGTVYGGCNISGDVGSRYLFPDAYDYRPRHERYQAVKGATYVKVSGGHIYNDLFAGSNGRYHCNNGKKYVAGLNFDNLDVEGRYLDMLIPSHNETHVYVTGGEVNGSVYAGGNMACVGFINESVPSPEKFYTPVFVGMATVHMTGGRVYGNVFGGGNMASIWGSNSLAIEGGAIDGALYGGNDRLGLVAQITNRVLPSNYGVASDNYTSLADVRTYVSVTGRPQVGTVYGGGNGDYDDYDEEHYCNPNDQPVQSNTFVDINIDGYTQGSNAPGHINTVYGGGNGVTVTGTTTVFMNVKGDPDNGGAIDEVDHVGVIFGGNNKGPLAILPDIILLKGRVNTVYGGCNSGDMIGDHSVTYGGVTYNHVGSRVHLRNSYPSVTGVPTAVVTGNVYGGCKQADVTNNTLVVVEGGTHPANFYGGCDISGDVAKSQVVLLNGTIGNAFGGGNGDYDYANGTYASLTPPSSVNTQVDILNGTVNSGVYGGNNAKGTVTDDVVVNVIGGTIGASTSARADVYGGGYGHETHTSGNVTVNIASNGALTGPTINGDIYGGSALGQVSASDKTTTVNFYKGTINGDVYGGGLGNNDYAAEVSGDVEVNIRGGVFKDAAGNANVNDGDPSDGNTGGGCIYGCNNANGSPKGNVTVNIYATDHGNTEATNHYPTTTIGTVNALNTNAETQTYAIKSVFGGGNLAAYVPDEVTTGDPHSATVHVYNCDNTIENIFGGGNAANVGSGNVSTDEITLEADTYVIIEGGRMHRVIGGGNGEDLLKPAANIFGTANTTVYAGLIDEVYGGANVQGSVDAINLDMNHSNTCGDEVYGKVFGCANAADYNRSVTTTIECNVGVIGELYGGSNQANIGTEDQYNADVTLNIYGGTHTQVFAGSKGIAAASGVTPVEANIYGNVTLNLFGGTIGDAFGGSDANGNIAGTITVNVLDKNVCHPLDVTNIFGASNLTAYSPNFTPSSGTEKISPVVNVIHIAQASGIRGNVYGGGNQAEVTASPQVNIGYDATTMAGILTACGYTQPNGFPRGYVSGNVFGGGNQAGVTGNPVVNMRDNGTVVTGIYGGCNDDGEIDGNINVNIYGGTMGTSTTARMTDGIFGGGKGNSTETSGNITVTINKETNEATAPIIYADIYGGSAFGEVGATGKTAKVNLKDGTVYGTIFGGGKGQLEDNNTNPVTPAYSATVSGSTEVAIEGGDAKGFAWNTEANAINAAVFGGCNVNGIVLGNATVSYTGGTIGTTDDHANTYGGGLGPDTKVKGDVDVTVDGRSGVNVYGDVYGGSAKGKVNTENGTSQSGTSKTDVTLTTGTVHGNLYGGGHGPDGNEAADVYGPITVTVEGGTATTAFGCNNNSGTPKSTVTVNIEGGTVTNVCGGGNVADYIPTTNNINSPAVNVKGGEVTNKVVGGGNAANIGSSTISCNPVVTISGGQVCTATTDAGVYGGCNTSGTVNGNITVNVTNADGNTTISSLAALQAIAAANGNPISIHGGGYGDGTGTTGHITVNFGAADASSEHSEYPMLYGDIYGGSALGTVNDDENDITTVTVLNGEVKFAFQGNNQYGGNIYGGGLGDASHAAIVNGVVHVNIGNLDAYNNPIGKASLKNCNVFGCNNKNGSPQRDVHVDVYQTNHTSSDEATNLNGDFAINSVYGGGNRANYSPTTNPTQSTPYSLKAYTTIHGCENTIGTVYGGGRAAASDGVVTNVDGGRFQYIFGGGNGQIDPADIGWGGIELTVCSGHVGYKYVGCDMGGTVLGTMHDNECSVNPCGTPLTVDYFFFGANKSTIIGGLSSTIPCADPPMTYQNVYAGSRLAVIYGDIHLVVEGGEITNLFGGSQGSVDRPGHVRRYPHLDNSDEMATVPQDAYNDMVTYLSMNPDLQGEGGNIYLTLKGGTLRNVYGGNQLYGTVDGDIIILVDDDPTSTCPLVIDTLYGGNEKAVYSPYPKEGNPRVSPQIYLKNGTVNYDVYGGSLGDRQSIIANAGKVNSHPYVLVGSDSNTHHATVGRNLYGGGSMAEVNGDTKVVLRGNATIGSDVYGGSRQGDVTGNTYVQIEPASVEPISIPAVQPPTPHTLNYGLNLDGSGTLSITNNHGDPIANGAQVAQGSVIHIHVIPNQGYEFYGWGVVGGGSVVQPYQTTSSLIIGSSDVTLTANFTDSNTTYHTLTLAPNTPGAGTFKVNGNVCNGSIQIPQGFPVTVQAIHEEGYVFGTWTVPSGLNITSGTTSTASITFNMGTGDVNLTANFTPTHTLTLTADPDGACTFTVKDDPYTGPVTMAEGTTVTLVATPAAGHEGDSILWSTNSGTLTGDTTSNTVTFTMGNANANVTVTFTTNP